MATVADSAAKPRTKTAARPRSAAAKPAVTAKAAPAKRAVRKSPAPKAATSPATVKPAAAKTVTQKLSARALAAEQGAASTASHAVEAIKAAAEKAIEASHVKDAAKAVKAATRNVGSVKASPKPRTISRKAAAKPSTGVGTGTMIGVAAAGLAAGLVANLGRKAAVQAPSVMAGDWLEALKAEHKAALALLDKLAQSSPGQPAKRTLLLTQLKHALGKHAFTEENVIYPALREWGDKADADALNHEQGYHKQFLYELDAMDKSAPEFALKVADFRADLDAHIREEEDKIFPKLHGGLSAEKNKALTGLANREGFKMA
ncbi:hemerythrin domain-containing protein [Sphingomonas abietis]|uniref:Hemerythrin domain-containing protein n=1 Tax=Sphingomonas abietis TaxID=3012344 RepID=A0ABY7NS32_9SPHN|nr:hemerythrin domain-containing protein [Sphingomonas abietis]WBO23377.1 hemerythrin domain-containing protein [Sphingomonas abietis]